MEVITLNGREFVRAGKAAREVGYTSDYVGQLCREGAISAERVGRSWYVDREELREHKSEKKRNARTKAREHVRKAIQEKKSEFAPKKFVEPVQEERPKFEHRYLAHAQYATDDRPLIPEIKKTARNKDFSAYVVDDAPEIESTDTRVSRDSKQDSVPVAIKRHNISRRPRRFAMQQTRVTKMQPQTLVNTSAYGDEMQSYQKDDVVISPRKERSSKSLVLLVAAVLISLSMLTIESQISVAVANSSGDTLNQMSSGYSLNMGPVLSKIGL